MKECKQVLKIVSKNWTTLLYFEVVYKTFGFVTVFSFIEHLLSLLPGLAGVDYLSMENIRELFNRPSAVIIGLTILYVLVLYIIYGITAYMILCENGWYNRKIMVFSLVKQALKKTIYLLKPNRIGLFCMIPGLILSGFSALSGYLKSIRIPEFILYFLKENVTLYTIYIAVLVFFNVLFFLYIFGLPAMLFADKSFLGSWNESLRLLRGKKSCIAAKVIALLGMFLLMFLICFALGVIVLGLYSKIMFEESKGLQWLRYNLVTFGRVAEIVGGALLSAFLCAIIIFFYHKCRDDKWENSLRKKINLRQILFRVGSIFVCIPLLIFFSETEIGGNVFFPIDNTPIIIAHRAGAVSAPENTLLALSNTIDNGADMAEIDVQQLGDGTLIVMHDTNFKRTAGVDIDVWDTDYETVHGLSAGAYFNNGIYEEPIPTLDEFLQKAKGNINLMIELKTNGYEKELVQKTLQMIYKYEMQTQCMIASMDLSVLRQVKELDNSIETVYISAILITNQYDLNYVDVYSIETTSLSTVMTAQAHFQGKKVYGWTANSRYSINKILRNRADGIITDNTLLASYFIEEYGNNLLMEEIVGVFYK